MKIMSLLELVFVIGCMTTAITAAMPQYGDVCVTSRAVHPTPIGDWDTHPLLNTTGAAVSFFATRLDWVYTVDEGFIRSSPWPVTTAINANVPDNFTGAATYNVGRIENLYGQKLTAPWMRNWSVPPYYGCINSPVYTSIVFQRASKLVEFGSAGIQHDDPYCNADAVTWPDGGCYCSHCVQKFGDYAHAHGLAPNASFDYKSYLLEKGGYGKGSSALRVAFETFQKESVVAYHIDLRANITAQNGGKAVTLSCNNYDATWDNITSTFDFGMCELSASSCTPSSLRSMFLHPSSGGTLPLGKAQVVTMPKLPGVTTSLKLLTRKAMGFITALGGHMLAPWDIYLPTPNASRFYCNVSDFQDQFELVRMHNATLREFSTVAHVGSTDVLNVTWDSIQWTINVPDNSSACPSQLVVHAVDWDWPVLAPSSTVMYPLPANDGRGAGFTLLATKLAPPCSNKSLAAVQCGILGSGLLYPIDCRVDNASMRVSFTVPGETSFLTPWSMIQMLLTWA